MIFRSSKRPLGEGMLSYLAISMEETDEHTPTARRPRASTIRPLDIHKYRKQDRRRGYGCRSLCPDSTRRRGCLWCLQISTDAIGVEQVKREVELINICD